MHLLLIALHTLAGVLAFVSGCAVIRPPADVHGARFRLYLGSLVALVVFLVAAIASLWAELDTAPRLVYAGLTGLGLVMIWRAWLARTAPVQGAAYVEHIGFTLIALFDGFVIVSAIDLGAGLAGARHRRGRGARGSLGRRPGPGIRRSPGPVPCRGALTPPAHPVVPGSRLPVAATLAGRMGHRPDPPAAMPEPPCRSKTSPLNGSSRSTRTWSRSTCPTAASTPIPLTAC